MHLNPFAISGLLIVAAHLPLFIILVRKGSTKVARLFALHIFAIFAWGIQAFLYGTFKNPEAALIIFWFGYPFVVFISIFFLHAVLALDKKYENPILLVFLYGQGIIFSILTFTNQLIVSVKLLFNSFYFPQGNNFFLVSALLWAFNVIVAHGVLFHYYWQRYPSQRKKFIPFIITLPIYIEFGFMNYMLALGSEIYPVGNFIVPFYSLALAYAILKHQIMHIEIIIKKGVVYTALITVVSLLYLLAIVFLEKIMQGYFGYNSVVISLAIAFFIGLIFVPFRNKIQILVDRLFFKATPTEMAEEIKLLHREVQETEKFKTVATLASGVVHEVKNPLTTIRTMAEYLPQKMHDPKFVEQFSRLVPQEIDRIDAMIHELLQFARPSPPKLEPTNLYELLNSTLGFLSSNFTRHKINVQKDYEDIKDRPFLLDANQIKQVVLNLFLNAIDAMPGGGTLKVSGRVSNPSVVISVADTGCGIAPEDQKHIFEAFFTKKEKGTGLGLAVTKNIVEEHGGKISVKSKVGEGTTFTLEFPLNRDKRES